MSPRRPIERDPRFVRVYTPETLRAFLEHRFRDHLRVRSLVIDERLRLKADLRVELPCVESAWLPLETEWSVDAISVHSGPPRWERDDHDFIRDGCVLYIAQRIQFTLRVARGVMFDKPDLKKVAEQFAALPRAPWRNGEAQHSLSLDPEPFGRRRGRRSLWLISAAFRDGLVLTYDAPDKAGLEY